MERSMTLVCGFIAAGFGIALCMAAETAGTGTLVMVKAKSKPSSAWKEYPTRTVANLAGYKSGGKVTVDRYGGDAGRRFDAAGFFRTRKVGQRWWLIDPDGHPFLHAGVASVTAGKSPAVQAAMKQTLGSREDWAKSTSQLLRSNGFVGTGAWSDNEALRKTDTPLVYTAIWNFMSGFGKSKGIVVQKPGHAGYPNDCFPVFHPEFAAYCDAQAKQLGATKDDPYLLGHFSDNELPFPHLDKYLALEENDVNMGSCRKTAQEWLAQRKGRADVPARDITAEDRDAFAGFVWDRYFQITTAAIRKHDPNHLCLGSRFHSIEKKSQASFAAAGKHLDVISVNLYGQWTPDLTMLRNWERWSNRPVIITEWYTKGEDSGMANTTGAGWIVPTQADRGLFYQNFTLALLESRVVVGWHWFKYQDNDPADLRTDPSNRDSNKGIVNIAFKEYGPLLERMKALNAEIYSLAAWFDR